MFGPDRCGSTNKVHFIFNHKNPKTGEYEEKHAISPPMARIVKQTALYTLWVRKDNYFEIRIDGTRVKNGTLLEDFQPAVNPAKEIPDPEDKKPEDWVDAAMIPDPEATKPEDWDEDAPFEIPDEEATKPEDWLDDEPLTVVDPEAVKPEGWVDEEDGDWEAPTIANPKCQEASGCGPWERPSKANPAYKGKWIRPQIDNPDFKGPWSPRNIPNPDYYEDKTPSNFEPVGGLGFELWTMSSGILFDNIYIGHSIEEAESIQKATFDIKHEIEQKEDEATRPKQSDDDEDETPKASPQDIDFKAEPVRYIKENLDLFVTLVQKDPVEAVRFMPVFAAALGSALLAFVGGAIAIVSILASGGAAAPAVDKAKKVAKDVKEKAEAVVDSAVATGSEAPAKVTKRGGSKKE